MQKEEKSPDWRRMNNETMEQINKIVPELRFPEFVNDGEWIEEKLGEIAEIKGRIGYRGYTVADIVSKGQGAITLSPSNFDENGTLNFEKCTYITWAKYEESPEIQLEEGQTVLVKTASVGKSAYVQNLPEKATVNPQIVVLKSKTIHNKFLSYCILHDNIQNQIKSCVGAGAIPNLSQDSISKFKIILPSDKEGIEQQKIADCLTSLDELITAQTDKLEIIKNHRKGLLQNLFPQGGLEVPKYRFPEFLNDGEWKEKELGDKEVAFIVNEKVSVNNLQIENYISTENMLPNFNGVSIASKLPSSGKFTYFKIGDILISNIRPYLKKVWKSNKTGGVSNDVFVFRAGSDSHSNFLEFILKNDAFINYVMKSAKGVKMPRGDRESILKYKVSIPSKFEQQKIAECLMEVDNLINAQIEKIEQLNTHKKGLMQGLFPKVKN